MENLVSHKVVLPLVAAVMIYAISFGSLYALSVGPVFAYYARHAGGSPMPLAVYDVYRPLFRALPETTTRYLDLWGVSNIEAYFITNQQQNRPANTE